MKLDGVNDTLTAAHMSHHHCVHLLPFKVACSIKWRQRAGEPLVAFRSGLCGELIHRLIIPGVATDGSCWVLGVVESTA